MDQREVIWFALHDALPPGWTLGEATLDAIRGIWTITAMSPRPRGRQAKSEYVLSGSALTEVDAVRDLTRKLLAWDPERPIA